MDDADAHVAGRGTGGEFESREPSVEDLVELCRNLNELGAEYIIIGGFAMRACGFDRRTMDIDILVATGSANERRVIAAAALAHEARQSPRQGPTGHSLPAPAP